MNDMHFAKNETTLHVIKSRMTYQLGRQMKKIQE
jgi:hypothetical protein